MNHLHTNTSQATLKSYTLGFVTSLAFTLSAYAVATSHSFSSKFIFVSVVTLAFLQLVAQLIFFLHLGSEKKPQWNLFIFFTTLVGIFILVFGSLWIMDHLNYAMTPQDMNSIIIQGEGLHQ